LILSSIPYPRLGFKEAACKFPWIPLITDERITLLHLQNFECYKSLIMMNSVILILDKINAKTTQTSKMAPGGGSQPQFTSKNHSQLTFTLHLWLMCPDTPRFFCLGGKYNGDKNCVFDHLI
jgi:hypothetical protein